MVSIGALALALASWNVAAQAEDAAPAGSEVGIPNDGIAFFEGIDVYLAKCTQPSTYLCVSVSDDGDDDELGVTILGLIPAKNKAKALSMVDEAGDGAGDGDCFTRNPFTNGGMQAYVTVALNKTPDGFSSGYTFDIQCYDSSVFPTSTTVVQKQNQ